MIKFIELKLNDFLSHKESVFIFRNGQVSLLIGENFDDSSQKGNGSGKSAIIEGISYLVTGSSIRNIKDRELIKNGEIFSTIQLIIFSTKTNTFTKIERKISSKESSSCKIFQRRESENEYSEIVLSSVLEYNKFILEKIFDISREDFWNYFLITRERYQNFFSSSDTYKKQIINRFSKSDILDNSTQVIDFRISSLGRNLKENEKNNFESILKIKEELLVTKREQSNVVIRIKDLEQFISEKVTEKEQLNLSLEKITKDGLAVKEKLEYKLTEKEKLSSLLKDKEEINKSSKEEIRTIYKGVFNELEDSVKNIFLSIKSLEKDLLDEETHKKHYLLVKSGTITCPSCNHKFLLNEEVSVEDVDLLLDSFDSTIKELEVKISKKKEEFEFEKSTIKTTDEEETNLLKDIELKYQEEVAVYSKQMTSLLTEISELELQRNQELSFYKNVKFQIDSIDKTILSSNQELEKLKNTESFKKEIKVLEEEIEVLKLNFKETFKRLTEIDSTINNLEVWKVLFKRFKTFIANKSVKTIESYTNLFLEKLESNLSIQVDGYKQVGKNLKEEISVEVLRNGFSEGSYGKFSAGERSRIDICVILAIQESINLNSNSGGIDLLICDEILDSVDQDGLVYIVNSLANINKTIIIVSQNEISSLQQQTVIIRKQNQNSIIL